ncbi:MAG: methyltransferase [Campylobacter sp.]|nr:methyltransferase [Campylobacter sp.]
MILFQHPSGYRYNSDSLFLYDFISEFKPSGKLLDVGCGCGILGLLLKRDFAKIELFGIDKQGINIEISKQNAKTNDLEANFFQGDFCEFKSEERFDFIVSNPPFYHDGVKQSQNSHMNISKYEHHLSLKKFLSVANSHLKPNGTLCFCYEAGRVDEIFSELKEFKLKAICMKFVYAKQGAMAKLVLLTVKKNSRSLLKILEPLYAKEGVNFSKEAGRIYAKANTTSKDYAI